MAQISQKIVFTLRWTEQQERIFNIVHISLFSSHLKLCVCDPIIAMAEEGTLMFGLVDPAAAAVRDPLA